MSDTAKNSKRNMVRIIGGIGGILAGVFIAMMSPPAELTSASMLGLGIFVWAIVWMMCEVLQDYAMGILLMASWVISGAVSFNVAFSPFAGQTFWLVIGGIGLGFAATHTGIMKRLALFLMTKFPVSFKGQTLALLVSGTFITPLVPSNISKVAMMAPLSKSISDNMGYKPKSEEAGGIFAAMFVGTSIIYPMFMSSGFMCYVLKGLLPEPFKSEMNWTFWLVNAAPWGITVLILSYFAIQFLYRQSSNTTRISTSIAKEELKALGPMRRNEAITGVVIVLSFLLWMTESLHGISATLVSLPALAFLLGVNIVDRKAFKAGMPWDAILFVGFTFTIGSVFKALNIETWVAKACGPYIEPLMGGNIFIFLAVLAAFISAIRLFLVGQTAVLTIFTIFLTPFALKVGLNPWVCGFAIFTSMNVFYVMYQSSQYITAFYATGGEMVTHRQVLKLCCAYMAVNLIGLFVSVPVWMMTGLIK
jgi:DASS family divalent anion:Na+ symporter